MLYPCDVILGRGGTGGWGVGDSEAPFGRSPFWWGPCLGSKREGEKRKSKGTEKQDVKKPAGANCNDHRLLGAEPLR